MVGLVVQVNGSVKSACDLIVLQHEPSLQASAPNLQSFPGLYLTCPSSCCFVSRKVYPSRASRTKSFKGLVIVAATQVQLSESVRVMESARKQQVEPAMRARDISCFEPLFHARQVEYVS